MVTAVASTRLSRRSGLYVGIGLLGILFAVVGFWPSYFRPVLFEAARKATVLHVHGAVFVGWLVLFTAQAYLAATRRVRLHIRIGHLGIVYGALVVTVGLTTGYVMSVVYVEDGDFVRGSNLLYSTLLDMVVFTSFFVAAILFRRSPELHKRLMIIAGTSLLVAAVFRMPFLGQPRNMLVAHTIWLSPVALTMIADYCRGLRFQFVLLFGVAALMLQSPMFRPAVRETEVWRSVSAWLLNTVT